MGTRSDGLNKKRRLNKIFREKEIPVRAKLKILCLERSKNLYRRFDNFNDVLHIIFWSNWVWFLLRPDSPDGVTFDNLIFLITSIECFYFV